MAKDGKKDSLALRPTNEATDSGNGRIKIDPSRLRRVRKEQEEEDQVKEPPDITQGPINRVIDLAFNPSRDKIREVTVVDRIQGRLLPQLDVIDVAWDYVIQIAVFRQDSTEYERVYKQRRPIPPNFISDFTYRTAQWQKSIMGTNLKSAIDLALAETETEAGREEPISGTDHGFQD